MKYLVLVCSALLLMLPTGCFFSAWHRSGHTEVRRTETVRHEGNMNGDAMAPGNSSRESETTRTREEITTKRY